MIKFGICTSFRLSAALGLALLFVTSCQSEGESQPIEVPREPEESAYAQHMTASIEALYDTLEIETGLCVGVIQGDSVWYMKGFGYRNLDQRLPMTTSTPFYISSTTKAFMALVAVKLEAEGVIDLQQSLAHYMPDLDLGLPYQEEDITIESLITHTHGIQCSPMIYMSAFAGIDDERKLRTILEQYPRARRNRDFRYSNEGNMILGFVLEEVTGTPWRDLLKAHVFEPLEMHHTSCYVSDYERDALTMSINVDASPTSRFFKQDNTMHAAGGIITTMEDMMKFMQIFVNGGEYDGHAFLTPDMLQNIKTAHATQDRPLGPVHRTGYGLGLDLATFDTVHQHAGRDGGFQGLGSQMSFLPEHDLGVVVFGNSEQESMLAFYLADLAYRVYLGTPEAEERGLNRMLTSIFASRERRAEEVAQAEPAELLPYPHDKSAVVGRYFHELWGAYTITEKEGSLYGQWNNLEGPVTYEDTAYHLSAILRDRHFTFVEEDGVITGLNDDTVIFEKQTD